MPHSEVFFFFAGLLVCPVNESVKKIHSDWVIRDWAKRAVSFLENDTR